jgi:putative flippase GtrA
VFGNRRGHPVTTPSGAGIRYALVSVASLATDFVVTLTLHSLTPLPLSVCAAITFVAVGVTFYFIHEHWTFRSDSSRSSPTRMFKNFLVLCAAFATRIGVIATLEFFREPDTLLSVVYFGVGAGLSFTVNFLANKLWVFRQRQ